MRFFLCCSLLVTACAFDPSARKKGNCSTLVDGDGKGATALTLPSGGAGSGGLWFSAASPNTCCAGANLYGAKSDLAYFDLAAAHEGDNEVVPCVASGDWPTPCNSGHVEGRYYYPSGMAGGTGTLHIDAATERNPELMSGWVDVTFVDGSQKWRLHATFNAPVNCSSS